MKEKLKNIIKSFYFKLGYFPPERILSGEQIRKDYKNASNEIKEYVIRKYANYFSENKNVNKYNSFLKGINPSNNLKFLNTEFFKNKNIGIGQSSLNTFRKVICENKVLFEKIYFSHHQDLNKMLYFYKEVYPFLKNKIQVPKIEYLFRDNIISTVYYTYNNLKSINDIEDLQKNMVQYSLYFIELSLNNSIIKNKKTPNFIYNYHNHFLFKKYHKYAEAELQKYNISIFNISKSVKNSPLIITHGDLYKTNVYSNNYIIDWDSFGIYPIGFEVAFIYQRLLWKEDITMKLKDWLSKYYFGKIDKELEKLFFKNVCYFLFVFNYSNFKKNKNIELKQYLIQKLKSL